MSLEGTCVPPSTTSQDDSALRSPYVISAKQYERTASRLLHVLSILPFFSEKSLLMEVILQTMENL
jgi:hypothetical protein